MTEVADAESAIFARMPRFSTVRVPLETAAGRVLAEDVLAERDQPPFDRVTMDGIAVAFDAWRAGDRSFDCAGTQAAGVPALTLPGPGHCVEVMTGAMLPDGADAVIPVERVAAEGNLRRVSDDAAVRERQFVHARGSDGRAGDRLLRPGMAIGAPEVAVLASAGLTDVAVAARPRVVVVSTGDELVGLGEPIAAHQIRSTNDLAVAASLEQAGLATVTRERLRDDEAALLAAMEQLHETHDVLILSGGVSMGQFDFVPAVLERLGAQVVFHKIEQKPGRPMWFGVSGSGKPIFALPGNPVSTLVCATRYIVPALRHAAGLASPPQEHVSLTADVEAPAHLTYFVPVKVRWSDDGRALADPRPTNTSGDFVSLAGTDGVVELGKGRALHPAGTTGRLFRW
jgi:molybdopterin molybdotransferase